MTDERHTKMLERVRALLAKAESTEFPEEAETFRAKADELMTAYSIDAWAVEAAQRGVETRATPTRRDFDRSWRHSKFRNDMLWMFESLATHCRCVVGFRGADYRNQTMPVYGLPSDLDYFDLLYTQMLLEVAKNLQPPVNPNGEVGHEVYKQRQAGIGWEEIVRKTFEAGLVGLTKGEVKKLNDRYAYSAGEREDFEFTWVEVRTMWRDLRNRIANYNRRYVRQNGLQGQRNYVKPEVYQRSFMMGFSDEIDRRLWSMSEASRRSYDAGHGSNSMALAVRDIRSQALALYDEEFPPPPPVPVDPNAKPSKAVAVREVAVSAAAMSAGRAKAREVSLTNNPNRRTDSGGTRREIES